MHHTQAVGNRPVLAVSWIWQFEASLLLLAKGHNVQVKQPPFHSGRTESTRHDAFLKFRIAHKCCTFLQINIQFCAGWTVFDILYYLPC